MKAGILKAGMLVKIKHSELSAENMGLIIECDSITPRSPAKVQRFDGNTYWICSILLEEVKPSDKKLEKNT